MKTKLTLTVDSGVIHSAKQMARRHGTSVSSLFEEWTLRMAAHEQNPTSTEMLTGLWKSENGTEDDLEQTLLEALLDKYGS